MSEQILSTPAEWTAAVMMNKAAIDNVCSQIIQVAVEDAVASGLLDPADVHSFAESLVYDERQGACYAYDPRDALKRRLQSV